MLLMIWIAQEMNDDLKGTNVFRHGLKAASNAYSKELEGLMVRDLHNIFGIEDGTLYKNIDYFKEFVKELSELGTDDIGVLRTILQQYKSNKQATLDALNIRIVEMSEAETGLISEPCASK